ncbi:MAG: YbaB/EbfC family nucleoid-associated protein [Dehalococcoidia bacterium]|nr:YbaB/EbfC family nucleoid-associated protein [Dehalococcoidia bacterium]
MNKNILRQAQQMQARLAKAQEELENATIEASSGGGAVKVVVTGGQKLVSIKISPEAVDPEDVSMLEDLVLAAVNEGMDKAKELVSSRLSAITGGLNLPGL